jgi:hypothetical protein
MGGENEMNGKLVAAWGTDSTVSQQYLNTFRRSEHFEPEKALLRAILEDAVHCYRKYQPAQNRAARERFREAETWIIGSGTEWIFSFENVCQLLGLDPMYVRQKLTARKVMPVAHGKPRQRSRRHAA